MVFTIRPYAERDAAACGECLYEGFFTAPIDHCDKLLLRDYAQVLIEKCNFTFVAPPTGGHRRNGSPRRAGVKDACTGDIQEQDWEPLNRGDCFETVENGSGCACYLLPANRLRDDESRGCRKRVTVPVGGTCGNGRIHAGSRLHLGRPVPSL